jgi:hypothetical protein
MLKKLKMISKQYYTDLIANFDKVIDTVGKSKNTMNVILFLLASQENKRNGEQLISISGKIRRKKQYTHSLVHDLVNLNVVKKFKSPVSNTVLYSLKNGSSFYRGVLCYVSCFALQKMLKQGKIKENEL